MRFFLIFDCDSGLPTGFLLCLLLPGRCPWYHEASVPAIAQFVELSRREWDTIICLYHVSGTSHMRGSMPAHATRGTDSAPSEEFSPHSCRFFLQAGLGGRYHPLLLSYFLEKTHPRLELGQSRLSRKIQLTDRTRRLLKKNQWYNIVHRQHSESVRQLPPATFAPVRRGVFRTG